MVALHKRAVPGLNGNVSKLQEGMRSMLCAGKQHCTSFKTHKAVPRMRLQQLPLLLIVVKTDALVI